ncbi:MAG: hypothetical protein FWE61_00795 [Micrococcales bacterium]|nr:hypothetical protein [Micrococcales bacterium]
MMRFDGGNWSGAVKETWLIQGAQLWLVDVPPSEPIDDDVVVSMRLAGVREDGGQLWVNLGIYYGQEATRLAVGEAHTIPGVGTIWVLDAHPACQGRRGLVKAEARIRFEPTKPSEAPET